MNAKGYFVVYDILRDGIGVAPLFVCLGMLIGFGFGIAVIFSQRRKRRSVVGGVVWLVLWGAASFLGGGNVLYQHFRCVAWAQTGDFDVLEGRVIEFQPMAATGKGSESFTVNAVTFTYGDHSLGQGGFRYSFGSDGPMHEGVQVRVSHHDGRILKLEILDE